MRSNLRIISILFLPVMFIASCAKVSSPVGGAKDEQPPVVLDSEPKNWSLNFDRSAFEIRFDEYFVLDNVDQALMISPPLDHKPEIKVRGKSLIVELHDEEELRENVTYSFNFLNSIRDLNEGNPLENFKYVFSTGNVIDSLSVTGYIYDALNLEAGEDILVMLHSGLHDSLPGTTQPDYITRAYDDGKYRIDNIAGGEYKIYGLSDNNNNKIYDMPGEAFAFLDTSIYISPENNYIPQRPDSLFMASDTAVAGTGKDTTALAAVSNGAARADSLKYEHIPGREYKLYYFTAENEIQYLTGSSRSLPYLLQFTFSLPLDTASFNIEFADTLKEAGYIREVSSTLDTFKIWLTDSSLYSRELITAYLDYPETDTLGQLQMVSDTLKLRYAAARKGRGKTASGERKLIFTTNLSQRAGLVPGKKPHFAFQTPVEEPDTSKIQLFLMNDTLKQEQDYTIHRDSLDPKKFIIDTELVPDSSYMLVAEQAAFENIYGHTSDSLGYNFRVRSPDEFGKLIMNLSGYEGNIIIRLLDAGEELKREKKIMTGGKKSLEFPYLAAGQYLVKIIFDLDGNGEWTTGDYEQDRQPEPVTYFPKKIDLKVGWELTEDWQVSMQRQKDESISTTRGSKEKK